jgi:hypothetical protein
MHILSPKDIATLPEFFKTVLSELIPTPPEKEGANEGSLHLGEPWVCADVYTCETFPLRVCHFNTEEGFQPLPFICFTIQDKKPYIFGTAGVGEPMYRHLLRYYPC